MWEHGAVDGEPPLTPAFAPFNVPPLVWNVHQDGWGDEEARRRACHGGKQSGRHEDDNNDRPQHSHYNNDHPRCEWE